MNCCEFLRTRNFSQCSLTADSTLEKNPGSSEINKFKQLFLQALVLFSSPVGSFFWTCSLYVNFINGKFSLLQFWKHSLFAIIYEQRVNDPVNNKNSNVQFSPLFSLGYVFLVHPEIEGFIIT